MLRWGRQRGKERGVHALTELRLVEDLGMHELRLVFTTGSVIELGASCAVEKALLLRSFTMVKDKNHSIETYDTESL